MINVELFCGSSGFTNVSRRLGMECLSVDIRRRKGVCEPHFKMDVMDMPYTLFESMQPFIMWIGLPCDIWSLASGGHHLDKNFNPLTEKAEQHLEILFRTMGIIYHSKPKYWVIENPRGKLRNYPRFIEFLKSYRATPYECTLSSYGFPTTKPTNVFSNCPALILKELDSFGRGAKNKVPGAFNNLTKTQRQKTPESLYKDVITQILHYDKLISPLPK